MTKVTKSPTFSCKRRTTIALLTINKSSHFLAIRAQLIAFWENNRLSYLSFIVLLFSNEVLQRSLSGNRYPRDSSS